ICMVLMLFFNIVVHAFLVASFILFYAIICGEIQKRFIDLFGKKLTCDQNLMNSYKDEYFLTSRLHYFLNISSHLIMLTGLSLFVRALIGI
ncbi:MAG: hypothetical protein AAGE89_14665, partial [Pseudomonadota bacterium]